MKKNLPEFLQKYFWDVDFGKLDPEKKRIYILKRVLNDGDEKAVAWAWKKFSKAELREALVGYRGYSLKSANYWALMLGIPKGDVLCLKRRLSKKPGSVWPY